MNDEDRKNFKDLDGWIEQLMECKQLSENQVSFKCHWEVCCFKDRINDFVITFVILIFLSEVIE